MQEHLEKLDRTSYAIPHEWCKALEPPPKLTISEWADAERVLSRESSAEPGRWDTSRAEYQRGIMDACSAPECESVVIMAASQSGKTEIVNNVLGFYIQHDPAPILVLQPTLDMAQSWSKDRLAPMLRDTPALKDKVKDPRSRDSNNTVLHKVFEGGHITTCGANSAASLASRPIRVVLCDEVDRYPPSAGTEGDPVALAKKRSSTFWNRKLILVSTPTNKGASRIEAAYELSDKRKYFVRCVHCDYPQIMEWANVKWTPDKPEFAAYECKNCETPWSEADRLNAIKAGEWKATAPFKGTAGFHLPGLCSPWIPIPVAVQEFLEAKKLPETLKVWVNTYLGESWEEQGQEVDNTGLYERTEEYDATVLPEKVYVVTAGIDVQDDRIEAEIVGWGRYEESWSIDYQIFYGDPSAFEIWRRLDLFLSQTWEHKERTFRVAASCIDTGGHHTQATYSYVKTREHLRVFAVKGIGGEGKALIGRPSRNNSGKIKLFPVGVDTAKDLIYSRLKIEEPGPGYCHFPKRYDFEYFKQLTAERCITKFSRGFAKRVWVKKRDSARNEALDCRVYAVAAFALLNTDINRLADKIERHVGESAGESERRTEATKGTAPEAAPEPVPQPKLKRQRPRRRSNYMNGFRL